MLIKLNNEKNCPAIKNTMLLQGDHTMMQQLKSFSWLHNAHAAT